MSDRSRVVVTHRIHEPVKQLLAGECELVVNEDAESWPRVKLLEYARAAEAMLVFMPDQIDEAFLSGCPRLKVISAAFKGYDNIDVAACTRRGIWVTIVPDLLSSPTAELALALVLGLTRNLLPGDRLIRGGKFQGWRPTLYGDGLVGKTVGILGMGKLGQAFARLISGFNARIIYYDPVRMSPVQEAFFGISRAAFDDVLAQSDVLVLLLPLTETTLHVINATTLSKMKKGAYLVNAGRGSTVDEAAVARSLSEGALRGYAADVYEMEDLALPGHPSSVHPELMANVDHTVFTPHLGSAVAEVRLKIELSAAGSILQALRGGLPNDAINKPDFCSARE